MYQWLEKKDLDPTNKLTDGEWAEFIKLHEDSFAEEGTKLGISFLRIWISISYILFSIFSPPKNSMNYF